jgi:hypothetical protein
MCTHSLIGLGCCVVHHSAAEELQYQAKLAVSAMGTSNDLSLRSFESLFMHAQSTHLRYDCLVRFPISQSSSLEFAAGRAVELNDDSLPDEEKHLLQKQQQEYFELSKQQARDGHYLTHAIKKIHQILRRGLGDRVVVVSIMTNTLHEWKLHSSPLPAASVCTIGLVLDPNNAFRTVDMGPPADDFQKAARFRMLFTSLARSLSVDGWVCGGYWHRWCGGYWHRWCGGYWHRWCGGYWHRWCGG